MTTLNISKIGIHRILKRISDDVVIVVVVALCDCVFCDWKKVVGKMP